MNFVNKFEIDEFINLQNRKKEIIKLNKYTIKVLNKLIFIEIKV